MMVIITSSSIKKEEKTENKERVKTTTTFLMPFDNTFIKTAEIQDHVPTLESFGRATLTIFKNTQVHHYRWRENPVKRGNEENLSTWKYLFRHTLG